MKAVTKTSWSRTNVKSIETRKRDLVIRIANWTRDKHEPAYDVECFIKGVYEWNESQVFATKNAGKTKAQAKAEAIQFAQAQIAKLLF
jgi:dsRNA-specific ribonuclease